MLHINRTKWDSWIKRKKYFYKLHSVTKKKLSVPEGRPTQCGSWRHTKQPYADRFFISHWDREIFGSKVSKFHYFCIIFSFVMILMKNFAIYIINR